MSYGGIKKIFDFHAPLDYMADMDAKFLLKYLMLLYPLTPVDFWSNKNLQDFYYNLDFWYCFNDSWSVSPYPVTFDSRVLSKWEKNTFYQAGTIIQSSISSWSWGLDENNVKVYLAARLNNASQVDPSLSYTTLKGETKTIRSVTTDLEYWDTVVKTNAKIEVTSWGWNPYPFGIYLQGPFRGSGTFLDVPKRTVIGTCHWDIILKCKNESISDREIFSVIMNRELNSSNASTDYLFYKGANCTPLYIVRDMKTNTTSWETVKYWPLAVSYYCFIIGGFRPNSSTPYSNYWKTQGSRYAILLEKNVDGTYTFPVNQTTGLRSSDEFWWFFINEFFSKITSWNTNWAQERWRFPIFDGENGKDPCVANPCDDLMMAMATGNMDIVNQSLWNTATTPKLSDNLSKYSNNRLEWSHRDSTGFPYGRVVNLNDTYDTPVFCIRSQMPNVNGDICAEFADFRCTTPGDLANGTGDQQQWTSLLNFYAKHYLSTVDLSNPNNYKNFVDEYAMWMPDANPETVNISTWNTQKNVSLSKTFYEFDPIYGKYVGDNAYIQTTDEPLPLFTGISPGAKVPIEDFAVEYYGNVTDIKISDEILPAGNISALGCDIHYKKLDYVSNSDYVLTKMGGQPGKSCDSCIQNKVGFDCFTFAKPGQSYYPNPVDTFSKGNTGFMRVPGACNTRWALSSKGIPWRFDAPLANLLILKNSYVQPKKSFNVFSMYVAVALTIVNVILTGILTVFQNVDRSLIFMFSLTFALMCIYFVKMFQDVNERQKLLVYLQNLYPAIPKKFLESCSLYELRMFFCSLHVWYKGDNMPSPKDYISSRMFQTIPPFGEKSSWKSFTVRKNSIIGYPEVRDENNKVVIGWDWDVNTTFNNSPSCILYRGRELQNAETTNVQKTTFFQPAANMYIDTMNCFTTINDPDINAWENCEYVEVSTQWGPFPDGAYFDYAHGSGVFMKLGKHKVGYSGAHVVLMLGEELMQNKLEDDLKNVYWHGWQRAGYGGATLDPVTDTMSVNADGVISLKSSLVGKINGLYSTLVMTKAQIKQIKDAKDEKGRKPAKGVITQPHPADDQWWKVIADLLGDRFKYYDVASNSWTSTMPNTTDYVQYYPLPLPFGSSLMQGNGLPVINSNALMIPWKLQMFNTSELFRSLVLSAMFINHKALTNSNKMYYDFSDILKANVRNPLKAPNTYEDAINIVCEIVKQPFPHPFLSLWGRIESLQDGKGIDAMDGPELVLTSYIKGYYKDISFETVYKGALDKTMFRQDLNGNNGGINVKKIGDLPQFQYANLDIDHWQSTLALALGYESVCRIQHWCGSKNMAFDIEIINLNMAIPGNLLENKLYSDIFEIWRDGYPKYFSSDKNPLDPKNNPYAIKYKNVFNNIDLRSEPLTLPTAWVKPPWIGYNKSENLYGWPCEDLNNFYVLNRLSYEPIGNTTIPFSVSYPEYNKYTFAYLISKTNPKHKKHQ